MSKEGLESVAVLVIGAGIMGTGIAQIAAQSGQVVKLFDAREGAAAEAKAKLAITLDALVNKGKLGVDAVEAALARISPVTSLSEASDVGLVVEAIVEDLSVKRALLAQLEAVVGTDCILASNTSSISITALANGMKHPGRLVGMHFFNPVPLMRLVEVVSGLHTDPDVAAAIFDLSKSWQKVPVHARSTPGFIVNRIARPYYAEALALLQEQVAEPGTLDECLRAAGFRMGPCELMDLIGHDTNLAVTSSVYEANFFDKRFVPSLVQRELVEGGLLGRKTGRGFYRYPVESGPADAPAIGSPKTASSITVHGSGEIADHLTHRLEKLGPGCEVQREPGATWVGLSLDGARLMMTDGRRAGELVGVAGTNNIAVFDRPIAFPLVEGAALAYAVAEGCDEDWKLQARAWLHALGFKPHLLADSPGLVVARTVAMLINEGADAVLQGVCTTDGADSAMKLGVNYPAGPFEWLAQWPARDVTGLLDALDAQYRGERYRVSPWLRRRAEQLVCRGMTARASVALQVG